MKKFRVLFCLVMAVALLLTGCGGGEVEETEAEVVEIEEWTLTPEQEGYVSDAESVLNMIIGTYDVGSTIWQANSLQKLAFIPVGNEVLKCKATAKINFNDENYALYNPYERIENHVNAVGEVQSVVNNTGMNEGISFRAAIEMDGAMWLLDTESTKVYRYDRGFLSKQEFETGFPKDMNVIRWFYGYNSIFFLMEDTGLGYDQTAGYTSRNPCKVHYSDLTYGAEGEYLVGKVEGEYEQALAYTESKVLLLPKYASAEGAKIFDLLTKELTDFGGTLPENFVSGSYDTKNKCYWAIDSEYNILKSTDAAAWDIVYTFPAEGNPLTDYLRKPVQELVAEGGTIRLFSILDDGKLFTIQIPVTMFG